MNYILYNHTFFQNKHLFRIVRLIVLALFVSTISIFAGEANSQNAKVSIHANKIATEKVIKQIEKQTEYLFVYDKNEVNVSREVSLEVDNETVANVLDAIFKNTSVRYTMVGKNIMLVSNKSESQSKSENESQQDVQRVSGTIRDQKGGPIIGASIIIKDTNIGTISDLDGNFSLEVPRNAILQVSYIAYNRQEVGVAGKNTLNIVLIEDAKFLDEVVVVGYGVQKKVNLTGSITSVKTEHLGNIPAANLSNTIAGRAPGVTAVSTSGLAGASANIRIRGSFSEPLYVINGIIKEKTDFDALDANEVESINFLKDAASASIYGSKAGNGVVLVSTKTGIVQKPTFDYKGSFSTARTTREIQNYTATQEIEFVNRMAQSSGQPMPYGSDIISYFNDKSYNINDYIWQNPSVKQHNIGLRGGTEAINYYMSAGYHSEEGSYKNLNYDKFNFRSDVSAKITERFKINVNLSGNQRNYKRWYWPYDDAEDFNVGDFYRATFNWSRLYPFYVDQQGRPANEVTQYPVSTGGWHPVELMTNGGYRDIKYRTLDGIARFDLDLGAFVDGLSTNFQAHYTASDKNMKSFVLHNKAYLFQSGDAQNKFVPGPIDPDKLQIHNLSANYPNIAENVNFNGAYQINWRLLYEQTFAKHAISALAVYEQAHSDVKTLDGRADDLLTTNIDQIYNTSSDISRRWFDGSESESARTSWIGRVNYGFDNKYIAEFSFRYDGNYLFAKGKQWGFFPSASAAWRISEENFLKEVELLSNLKLRMSYGTTGSDVNTSNNNLDPFLWSQTYVKQNGFVFGDSFYDGLAPSAMPNPMVTWSTTKMYNIGLDYGFLDNKLSGEMDFFTKKQTNILGNRLGSTPTTLGATLPSVNYAERSWKGFELSLNWNNNVGEVKYSVYGNMGYAVDKWDVFDEAAAFTDDSYLNNWRSKIGQPDNRIYGLRSKGIIRTQAELDKLPAGFTQFGRAPKLGYLLFEDIRGDNFSEGADGKIDDNDKTYLSNNANPRINYGLGFRAEWRGISMNAHFQGVGAYDRMVSTRNGEGVFQSDRPYFELWASDYWTPDNIDAKYPRATGEWMEPDVGGGPSTFWMRNGAYLRLKNLDIAYVLPSKWYRKLGVQNVQIFGNATNLFCISGIGEHDPEQNTLDSYPIMKTFTAGISINF